MLEPFEILTDAGVTTVYGPLPPSKYGACVTRIVQPAYFHGDLRFEALFLDSIVRHGGQRGGLFGFSSPRHLALACACQLYCVRNAVHHALSQPERPKFVETARIDGVHARVEFLGGLGSGAKPEWFRICLFAGDEAAIDRLEIHGLESFDDFCSGWLLKFWSAPCSI